MINSKHVRERARLDPNPAEVDMFRAKLARFAIVAAAKYESFGHICCIFGLFKSNLSEILGIQDT